jgi:hypothetical protein
MRRFMSMRIMPGLAVKIPAVFGWVLTARREPTVVSLTEIVVMIDMPIEMLRPMKPGSSTDEYTALEPLRAIITIRGAVVRRYFIVPIRTNRWGTNTYRNLR